MTKQLFSCRVEELPVIGEFILSSAETDLADFSDFSPVFTSGYLSEIKAKITICQGVITSSAVSKELKAATEKLYAACADLRIPLNQLEGYLNLSAKELDIAVKDFGLKGARADITNGNVEGVIANTQKVLVHVTRNQAALTTVGIPGGYVASMETRIAEINALNVKQNELISKRGRLSDENMTLFNDLWESMQLILKTGRALYKGVNPVKLKDYTMSQLEKRVRKS